MTSVLHTAFSFDQSFRSQLVDQNDHAAGKHAKPFGEAELINRGIVGNEAKNAGMWARKSERRDSSPESLSRVRSDLGKEERRAGVPFFVARRIHARKDSLKNSLLNAMIHIMNYSWI